MASAKEYQAKAEAQFHRTIKKAHEAKQAVSQYEAAARATDEKTARLRALRLAKEAKEAAEASAAADSKAAEKKPTVKKKAVAKKAAVPEGLEADK
jgi:hypothetical protein